MKIKTEYEQSSGDESPKKRVERIACPNQPLMELKPHVSFQQKTEEEFPKPFHNERAKTRCRILFKKRRMMRSEVIYKVRSHWELRRSGSLAEDL